MAPAPRGAARCPHPAPPSLPAEGLGQEGGTEAEPPPAPCWCPGVGSRKPQVPCKRHERNEIPGDFRRKARGWAGNPRGVQRSPRARGGGTHPDPTSTALGTPMATRPQLCTFPGGRIPGGVPVKQFGRRRWDPTARTRSHLWGPETPRGDPGRPIGDPKHPGGDPRCPTGMLNVPWGHQTSHGDPKRPVGDPGCPVGMLNVPSGTLNAP